MEAMLVELLTKVIVVLGSVTLVSIAGCIALVLFVHFMDVLFDVAGWLIGKVRKLVRA